MPDESQLPVIFSALPGFPVSQVNWQGVPEGQRIGLMQQILGGVPATEADRVLSTMAAARNAQNANVPMAQWQTRFEQPTLEAAFQHWLLKNYPPAQTWYNNPFPSYDMRGFFKAMLERGVLPKLTPSGPAYPNTFNTPYSLDFGPESEYWKTKPPPR